VATETHRRALLGLAAGLAALPRLARAADAPPTVESVDLWPEGAPGGEKVTVTERVIPRTPGGDPNDTAFLNVTKPWLTMRRPAKPNGAAVLMIPGGGYVRVAVGKNGGPIDAWLASLGVTAFVMDYRLPADGWAAGPDVALQDAQRAMRLIRARAPSLGTQFDRETYAPVDAADRLPTRPWAAGLFYPVITATLPYAHGQSVKQLLGATPTETERLAVSAEQHVPADTPPTYPAAAADDRVVPVENSVLMWQALRAKKIPVEMHLQEVGGHGFGLRGPDGQIAPSMLALDAFFRRHGLYA